MSQLLEQLRLVVEWAIEGLGHPGIALIMFIENLFPPIPSELVLPFAGFLVAEGKLAFWGVLLSSSLGALLGAIVIYDIGRRVGRARLRLFLRRYGRWFLLTEADLQRSFRLFRQHDASIVFFARFIPLMRSLISLPAGMARMPFGRFLAFTTLGVLLWNGLLVFVGYLLGSNWQTILKFVDTYEQILYGLALLLVIVFVVRRLRQRLRSG